MKIKYLILTFLCVMCGSDSVRAQWFTFTSSNLPILIIDTVEDSENNSHIANLKIIENGKNQRNNLGDAPGFQGMIRILDLDSAMLAASKKSFLFVTIDEQGLPKAVSLLGMQAASKWTMGALTTDKSYIKTFLGFEIFRMLGNYAPHIRYCEVVLNNEYWGLYLFKEVIAPGQWRLRISELDSDDVAGDSLTGGYIIKVTNFDSTLNDGWLSEHISSPQIYYQYYYPPPEKIRPEQAVFIRNIFTNFESLMESSNYDDPDSGYRKFINVDNFADFTIIKDLCRTSGAFGVDAYMYYDGQSVIPLLHMGPVWDFTRAFDNSYSQSEVKKTPRPFWLQRLWKSRYFCQKESWNWYHLRRCCLTNSELDLLIDNQIDMLGEALNRNWMCWDPFFPGMGPDWEGGVARLKEYLDYRIDCLDHVLLDVSPTHFNKITAEFILSPNYPNPFNTSTRIDYFLAQPEKIRLEIYDVTGRRVSVLVDGTETAGAHQKYWAGKDDGGHPVASGVFFCRLSGEKEYLSHKMVLMK